MKKFVPLIIALIMGGVALYLTTNFLNQKKASQVDNSPKRPQVVVAKRSVEAGDVLTEEDLALGEISSDAVPDTVFKSPAELIGRVPVVPLIQGQAIVSTLLAPKGMGPGLQATVPIGMRAMTLEINEFTGLAGYLSPGCHVDMLQTMRSEKTGESVARTIVQNVKVTAVGFRHQEGQDAGGRSITVLVTPQQAELLQLACATGRPYMSLRSGNDLSLVQTHGITTSELIGIQSGKRDYLNHVNQYADEEAPAASPTTQPAMNVAQVAPATRPTVEDQWTMKVVRGSTESDVKFALHKDTELSETGH
jgi:pilus assembly protein CpaB